MKTCSIEYCNNKHFGIGYCSKHYTRLYRYGNINTVKQVKHGKRATPEYDVWSQMIQRCINKNNKQYHSYGGRGIKVCDRWEKSFLSFLEDVGERPFKTAQIDRIDNDGNYDPNNCRWVTRTENIRNSRTVKLNIEKARKIRDFWDSGLYSKKEIAEIYSVTISCIYSVVTNKTWIEGC